MKKRNIFWGMIFIFMAVLIVVNQLGCFMGIGFWSIIFTVILVAVLIQGIAKMSFPGILFPIAFLGIIYSEELNIEDLTPWPILLVALFGSIGLSLIFKKKKRPNKEYRNNEWHNSHGEQEQVINEPDSNVVNCSVKFSSSIKYINTDNFERANLYCKFGSLKVYFDNAILKNGQANIYVDSSFGGTELFIPRTWKVVCNVETSFGSVDEKNKNMPDGARVVFITGNVGFGSLEITYI